MPLTAAAIPIRLACSTRSVPPRPPLDQATEAPPQFWRGEDLDIAIGVFDTNQDPVDLSNLAFLELAIYPLLTPPLDPLGVQSYAPYSTLPYPSSPPAPLLFKSVAAADISANISWDAWANGTDEQAVFHFSAADTASLDLAGQNTRQFMLVVMGITTSGRKLTYVGGTVWVFESGAQGIYLPNDVAPVTIPDLTTFYVPENQQISFTVPIVCDGDLVLDGYLTELGNPATSSSLTMPNMMQTGDAVLNSIFGYFVAVAAGSILGAQVALQSAPVGTALILTLVDGAGASLAKTITIADGALVANVTFPSPLAVTIGQVVQLKVTQIGSTSPGGYVNANLVVQ